MNFSLNAKEIASWFRNPAFYVGLFLGLIVTGIALANVDSYLVDMITLNTVLLVIILYSISKRLNRIKQIVREE